MIYLDYNASTPVDPSVAAAIRPHIEKHYGNPSSNHPMGRAGREAVDKARMQVARMLHASADEIVFTSGGTEANNHAIKGVAFARQGRGKHIITSAVEHPAVINPCKFLERFGFEITYVGVDSTGLVDPEEIVEAIEPTTILISIMHAQNEVGTIQPIADIAEVAREAGILMHTDAAQSCGKVDVDVNELGVDLLTVAGHKMCAPKGVGALYMRKGVKIEPLHHGAGHESGRRAGTEPVAMIAGLGAAAQLAVDQPVDDHVRELRDRLHLGLKNKIGDDAVFLGHHKRRLPNTLSIGFKGRIGADILAKCPELAASTGAACHAAERKRSAVLAAMEIPEEVAFGAIRFSLGRYNTEDEIDRAVNMIATAVERCAANAS